MQRAHQRTGQSVEEILAQLSLPSATYYRWLTRQQEGHLSDRVVTPQRRAPLPTPEEVVAVCNGALAYPKMGYKRLAWQMVDEDRVYLRP